MLRDRAIQEMDQPKVSVMKGDKILEKGFEVDELTLEKYEKYLDGKIKDMDLLPKRVFVTFATFLFRLSTLAWFCLIFGRTPPARPSWQSRF